MMTVQNDDVLTVSEEAVLLLELEGGKKGGRRQDEGIAAALSSTDVFDGLMRLYRGKRKKTVRRE